MLVVAGVSLSVAAPFADDATNHHSASTMPTSGPKAHSGMSHGAGAYDYQGGVGTIPDLATALTQLERRSTISINNDSQFTPAAGVRSGSGTFDDPYVFSGWYVDTVIIKDTSKAFVFRENYVSNILVLDWTGQGGYVHHNHLENLRTNRNNARTGDPSASVIENNQILRIEQLRHFDGEVRNNVIGSPDVVKRLLQPDVIFDIAGLNGAGIHDNQIFGGVDMKIHGHHHSSAPGDSSHNHGEADATQDEDHYEDHQVRFVDFAFYNNRLVDDGFGLRYNDNNHAGDDRQATSEQEPELEMPHVHHTIIRIHDNVIEGATLRVAVVNSPDERHLAGQSAVLEVFNNTISKPAAGDGITIHDVRDAVVKIHDNVVEKGDLHLSGTSAIMMFRFSNSTVIVGKNALGDYQYGVRARLFDESTRWVVEDQDAPGVKQAVYWDSTVANAPEGGAPEPSHDDHEHKHPENAAETGLPMVSFDVRNTWFK